MDTRLDQGYLNRYFNPGPDNHDFELEIRLPPMFALCSMKKIRNYCWQTQ